MRNFSTLIVSLLCVVGLSDSQAWAQEPAKAEPAPDPILVSTVKDLARPFKRQAQRDPLVRSGLTLPEPQVTLETTRGKGRATGTIGLVKQHLNGETTLGLAVAAPIGDADDAEARPLDLRGLSNGATVTFNVAGSSLFKRFDNDDVINLCTDRKIAKEMCTARQARRHRS